MDQKSPSNVVHFAREPKKTTAQPSQGHILPNEDSSEPQLVPYHHRKPWINALYIFTLKEPNNSVCNSTSHEVESE